MVRSGPKSKSSEILWMSSILASMRKIRLKMKSLSIGHFPHCKSMRANFSSLKASNSKASIPIWPKFKLCQDFMPVLVPASLMKIRSKLKALSIRQSQIWAFFWHSRGGNSKSVLARFLTYRDFMLLLDISKFDEDPIKNEGTMPQITLPRYKCMGNFFDAQGQVTQNQIVRSRPNLNFVEILCLSWLSTSLMKMLSIWQHFPHFMSMKAISFRGNQSPDSICPQSYAAFPPPQWCFI